MKMLPKRRRTGMSRLRIVIGVAAIAMVAAACGTGAGSSAPTTGSGSAPGVNAKTKTITLGASYTDTGAVAYYSNYNYGAEALFDSINANGGIKGWKIQYKLLNDGYQPQQALQNDEQLVKSDHVFAVVSQVGSPTNTAAATFLGNKSIPMVGCCSGVPKLSQYKNYFILEPNYVAEAATALRYLVKTKGLTKIAMLYENDQLGQPALTGAQQEASKLGIKLLATVPFNVTTTNMAPYVSKVAPLNPQAIMIWGANGNVALAMKAAVASGVKTEWMGSFFMADPSTSHLGGSAITGLMATEYFAPYDGNTAAVKQFRHDMQTYEPKATIGAISENGYDGAAMFVWGLRRVIDSGKAVTQQNVIDVLNSMKNQVFGTVSVPQSYSPADHHAGYSSVQSFGFLQDRGGKWTPIAKPVPFPSGLKY